MKEQFTETSTDREWFAAWIPKNKSAEQTPDQSPIDQARDELIAVTGHLIDPSPNGVRACLPHLERAVSLFSGFLETQDLETNDLETKDLPLLKPAIDSLRAELALATTLFENAYTFHAAWAAQLGLSLDGTPLQILYGRPGQPAPRRGSAEAWAEAWEG